MITMIWVAVLAVLAWLVVVVVIKRQKSGEAPDRYVCGHCGEKDCNCSKQVKRGGPENDRFYDDP